MKPRQVSIVPLPKPEIDEMVKGLEQMIKQVKAGEFVSLIIGAFKEDAHFISIERGRAMSRLQVIGILECWKADMLDTMPAVSHMKLPDPE
jgi:hypothetical protein